MNKKQQIHIFAQQLAATVRAEALTQEGWQARAEHFELFAVNDETNANKARNTLHRDVWVVTAIR